MATIISSKTTGGGGLSVIGDSSGILQLASADGTTAITVSASQNVGIGTSSPNVKLDVRTASTGAAIQWTDNVNSTGFLATVAAGSAINTNTSLIFGSGVSSPERMRIDTSGNVLVTNPGGLGYGTGSGGTVTQVTSKTTAVTLNKPTGQITVSNVALAANSIVYFQLNNSLIASSDTVIATLKDGSFATQGTYQMNAFSVGAGYCYIALKNISAGSLSEAVVINFTILKGATS